METAATESIQTSAASSCDKTIRPLTSADLFFIFRPLSERYVEEDSYDLLNTSNEDDKEGKCKEAEVAEMSYFTSHHHIKRLKNTAAVHLPTSTLKILRGLDPVNVYPLLFAGRSDLKLTDQMINSINHLHRALGSHPQKGASSRDHWITLWQIVNKYKCCDRRVVKWVNTRLTDS